MVDASEVLPSIFLGSLSAAINKEWLVEQKITTLINVCEARYIPPDGVIYIHVPLRDGNEADLAGAFEKVYPLMRGVGASNQFGSKDRRQALLIHCQHGRSRSAALLLMFIMRWYREPLLHAFQMVKEARPAVMTPLFNFQLQLTAFERDEFGADCNSVLDWAGSLQPGGKRPRRVRALVSG